MIAYIIKVSLCWILFYALYQVLYKKITFFSANRVYLIVTLLLGVCIPLLEYVTLFSQPYEAVNYVAPILMEVDQFQLMVEEEKSFDYASLFLAAYLLGIAVVAGKFLLGMFRIYKLYTGATKEKKKNFTLVRTEKLHLPFSFYNCVFISNKLPLKEKINTILEHELCHINERHTFDVLLVELIKIAFWCSPPIYLYKKELKQVHEYIADNVTLAQEDKKEYGQLLLGQSSSGIELSLTHQFFNSHLKKRIQMMNQKKSSKKALVSYLALVPLLLLLGLSFSSYVGDVEKEDLENQTNVPTTNNPQTEISEKVATLFSNRKDLDKNGQSVYSDLRVKYPNDTEYIRKMFVHYAIETNQEFILDDYSIVNLVEESDKNIIRIDTVTTFDYDTYEESVRYVKVYDNSSVDSDPRKEIREKIASLFSNEKSLQKNGQNIYNELCTKYPKELDFIRAEFLQEANKTNQELILDDFSIVNVNKEKRMVVPERKVVRIDTVTTFDFNTYEEKVEIVKVYEEEEEEKNEELENEPNTVISIDTISVFDSETYEETVRIVRTFGKKSEASKQYADDRILELNEIDPETGKERLTKMVVKGIDSQKSLEKEKMESYVHIEPGADPQVFKVVEEMPRFPGCEGLSGTAKEKEECAKEKMLHFIYSNLKYPAEAISKEIEGMTVVQFVVEKNGTLTGVKLLREIGGGCGDASLAVVEKMNQLDQRWTPGKQRGIAVRVLYTLPIKYKLEDDQEAAVSEEVKEEAKETIEEKSPLIILDGKEVNPQEINSLTVESITVYKGAKAIEKFGSKGEHGVVEMFSREEETQDIKEAQERKNPELNNLDVFSNLSKMEFESFKVFPNPVKNQLNLSFISKDEGDTEIHLFDESGKQLMNRKVAGKECNEIFDLSHLQTTKTIFLTISQNNKTHTQKVIRTE